jgi:putative transposase
MMSSHLTVAALERAVADRQPRAGLVHHSDRGLQYASPEYVATLDRHGMIASMGRPANPYDNASCESFMKTLKREEIYTNKYDDLDHLRVNVEEFIEQYYNRLRLHSALGYRSPEEFEQETGIASSVDSRSATIEFFENKDENRQGESAASLGKGAPSPPSPDP